MNNLLKTHVVLRYLIMFTFLLFVKGAGAAPQATNDIVIPNDVLIYTPQEMLNFKIEPYLEEHAPHLVEYSEIISHWSGYSSISPKVLITLIERQSGLISRRQSNLDELKRPLKGLSNLSGFSEQVKDVANRLSLQFYKNKNSSGAAQRSLNQTLLKGSTGSASDKGFMESYELLFPQSNNSQDAFSSGAIGAVAPDNLFQLPYPVGESWWYSGSHTNTGSGSFPQSHLDLAKQGVNWGADTSNFWVSSVTGGTVVRHSSCYLEVIHSGGLWSSTYYHLDNLQVASGDSISINTPIANIANNEAQALCDGGGSTGPHVHFGIKYNGAFEHLNGKKLSGYTVHTGRNSYDDNCNYFWLEEDNGAKHCAWTFLNNPGVSSGTDQTISFSAPTSKNFGDASFNLNATATSGLAVTFSSLTAGVCTVTNSTVTVQHVGNCLIAANQAGDASTNPAPQIVRSIQIKYLLDIDGNGSDLALTDGLLVLRYLFGFTGDPLINNAIDTVGASRDTAAQIQAYMAEGVSSGAFDIDANSEVTALTDGLLILRYLFNFTGQSLISDAVGNNPGRPTANQIEAYLQTLTTP